jgi:hypothetical protein
MQKQLLFIFIMILIPLLSFSQSYKKWFLKWDKKVEIITVDNDTIKGLIARDLYLLGEGRNFKYKTITKNKKDRKKESIPHKDIQKIIYNGREHFRRAFADMNGNIKYFKLIYEHNNIRYYHDNLIVNINMQSPGSNGFIHTTTRQKEISYHFIEIDGQIIKVKNNEKKFIKQMKQLFGDCPEVIQKLENKEYRYLYEIKHIVKTYCEWLEQQDK